MFPDEENYLVECII